MGRSEFIEIMVVEADSVLLHDIELQDSRVSTGRVVLPDSTDDYARNGSIIVLAQYPDQLRSEWPDAFVLEVKPWPTLNNGGDLARVLLTGVLEDEFIYTSADYTRGLSIERIDPRVPAGSRTNWAPSIHPSGATPGFQNSVFYPDTVPPSVLGSWYSSPEMLNILFSEPVRADFQQQIVLNGSAYSGVFVALSDRHYQFQAPPDRTELSLAGVVDLVGNQSGAVATRIAQIAVESDLVISEIMYDPAVGNSGKQEPEWVEVYNSSNRRLSLAGITIQTGPDPANTSFRYAFGGDELAVDPGHFAILCSEGSARVSSGSDPCSLQNQKTLRDVLSFSTSSNLSLNNGGDTVSLVRETTTTLDIVRYDPDWHDLSFLSTRDRTLERIPGATDSQSELSWVTSVKQGGTPGELYDLSDTDFMRSAGVAGLYPSDGSIRINEIMYNPMTDPDDGLPDQVEYIEFLNVSDTSVDLNGLRLLSGSREAANQDTLRVAFRPTELEPDHIAVVFNVPPHIRDGLHNASTFLDGLFYNGPVPSVDQVASGSGPEAFLGANGAGQSTVYIPTRASIGLSGSGEYLQIISPASDAQESFSYRPEWHNPLVRDPKGRSLERLDILTDALMEENWSTSAYSSGGSPGRVNSVVVAPRPPDGASRDELGIIQNSTIQIEPQTIVPGTSSERSHASILVEGGSTNGTIEIQVFDLHGRMINSLIPADFYPGSYRTFWSGLTDENRPVPSGIYIVLVQLHSPDSFSRYSLKHPVAVFRR